MIQKTLIKKVPEKDNQSKPPIFGKHSNDACDPSTSNKYAKSHDISEESVLDKLGEDPNVVDGPIFHKL